MKWIAVLVWMSFSAVAGAQTLCEMDSAAVGQAHDGAEFLTQSPSPFIVPSDRELKIREIARSIVGGSDTSTLDFSSADQRLHDGLTFADTLRARTSCPGEQTELTAAILDIAQGVEDLSKEEFAGFLESRLAPKTETPKNDQICDALNASISAQQTEDQLRQMLGEPQTSALPTLEKVRGALCPNP